jgi:hypothetical protein
MPALAIQILLWAMLYGCTHFPQVMGNAKKGSGLKKDHANKKETID